MANNRVTAPGLCALGIVLNLVASCPAAAGAPPPPGLRGTTAPTFSGPGGSSRQFQSPQSAPRTEAPRTVPVADQHQAPDNGPRGGITDRGPAPAFRFGNFGQGQFMPGARPYGFDGRQGAWNAARPGFGSGFGFGYGPSIGRGFGPAGLFAGWAFSGGLFGPRAMMPVVAYRGWGFGGGLPLPSRGPVRPAQWGWANQNFPSYPQQGSEHRPSPYQGWARNGPQGQ